MTIFSKATFLISAAKLTQLPEDSGAEVAFVGRSNAGKSSALNAITNINGLARVSKIPGRTQLINLFTIDESKRLVDLPGYGFAKVPPAMQCKWQILLTNYLETRQCLRGLIIIMDIRHPLKPMDATMIDWAIAADLPVHILLTKADKLKTNAAKNTLFQVRKDIEARGENLSVQLFSATKKQGLTEARHKLMEWL